MPITMKPCFARAPRLDLNQKTKRQLLGSLQLYTTHAGQPAGSRDPSTWKAVARRIRSPQSGRPLLHSLRPAYTIQAPGSEANTGTAFCGQTCQARLIYWSTEESGRHLQDVCSAYRALVVLAECGTHPVWGETYDLMMFPRVWSSLLMVNKQALGTLVSLLMVILERDRGNSSSPHPALGYWP